MAIVVKSKRGTRVEEAGARGIRESILSGPAYGCNRFTVRKVTIQPDGRTARKAFPHTVVYCVLKGILVLSHDRGELDVLNSGDAATIHADETHHLHNTGQGITEVIKIVPQ